MSARLPLIPAIHYSKFTTDIDGKQYVFAIYWNNRDSSWYMDLLEEDETPIVQGVRIVLGTYLGRRVNHELFVKGAFQAFDLSGENRDATFDDIGTRVEVWYMTVSDLLGDIYTSQDIDS